MMPQEPQVRGNRNQDGGDGRGLFPFRKLVTSSSSSVNTWALVNSSGPAKIGKSEEISSKFFFLVWHLRYKKT